MPLMAWRHGVVRSCRSPGELTGVRPCRPSLALVLVNDGAMASEVRPATPPPATGPPPGEVWQTGRPTPQEVWQKARPRIEHIIGRNVGVVAFVDDSAVDYARAPGERVYVKRSSLFGLEAEGRWAPLLGFGSSWLNVALKQADDGTHVVALCRGGYGGKGPGQVSSINATVDPIPLTIEDD
jgi:hypothetical protein